jgi:hypothetical protein
MRGRFPYLPLRLASASHLPLAGEDFKEASPFARAGTLTGLPPAWRNREA